MITAVVMVAEARPGHDPVSWVRQARRAAARDLLDQLARQPLVERLVLATPDSGELAGAAVSDVYSTRPGPVHVGRVLSAIVERFQIRRLLYFGGGSAPLLSDDTLGAVLARLASAERLVLANNRFASDWAGVVPAAAIAGHVERLPQDNMLAWVLGEEAGLGSHTLPASAATRLDIDTPTELLTLRLHPATRPHLRALLNGLPLNTTRLEQALAVLATPASQALIAGRFGPDAWQALNRATRSWLRVISEERGMISSGRYLRGEVNSLFARYLEAVGLDAFFDTLPAAAGVAFIDTRVLLAHHGRWPPEAERFASDLGLLDPLADPWLRDLTGRALACPVPVILGGHSLMSGDMLAFCELLA